MLFKAFSINLHGQQVMGMTHFDLAKTGTVIRYSVVARKRESLTGKCGQCRESDLLLVSISPHSHKK